MRKRRLGKSSLFVSELALGSINFGGKITTSSATKILDIVYEKGVNLIDTSEVYPMPFSESGYGKTEKIIGKWLQSNNRDSIIISTKAAGPGEFIKWIRNGKSIHNRENLQSAVEGSLTRLGTDYIDIFWLNWPDRPINSSDIFFEESRQQKSYSIEETSDALLSLVKAGKIRHFGISNETPWGIAQYLKFGGEHFIGIQNPFNLINRGFEISHAEMVAMENLSLIAYSPLAGGLLGGKREKSPLKRSKRDSFWLNQYNSEQNLVHISKLKHIAEESNIKMHALALQFVLSFEWVASTIVGCSTTEQCRQNFINTSILDKKTLKKINKLHKQRMPPCN